MAEQYLSPQQRSRMNGGEPVQNPDGSRWRRGVKVSAGDAASTERTYAENAAHAAQGGQNPDRSRDPKAEGKLAEQRYLSNPSRYMAQGWDGQSLPAAPVAAPAAPVAAPAKTVPNSQDRGVPTLADWGIAPAVAAAPTAPYNVEAPGTAPTIETLPTLSMGPTQFVADGGLVQPYMSGGYTGPGPKMKPAGVVHAGEFVIPKEEVAKIGVPTLDAYFGTDSTKPKYGFNGGGAPVLDLSGVKVPNGKKIPPQVRLAAEELFRLGGKSNQQIVNALSRGNFDDIVAEAGKFKTRDQQTAAQAEVQARRADAESALTAARSKFDTERSALDTKWSKVREDFDTKSASYEEDRVKTLAEQLKVIASDKNTLEIINKSYTYARKETDQYGMATTVPETRVSIGLPPYVGVDDPELDKAFEAKAALLLSGAFDKTDPLSGYVREADKRVAATKGAALLRTKSELDSLEAQRKQLASSEVRIQTTPEVSRAEKQLAEAESRAAKLGLPPSSAVAGAQAAATPRISEEESRATSFAGGPGAYFSPYVVDPNTGFPKNFATIDEARAAATGKAPAAAAPLAEFMAPTVAATVAPASVVEEMYVPSADEELGFFPAPVPETPAVPVPVPTPTAPETPAVPVPVPTPTAPATPSFGWGVPNQIPEGLSGEGMANWMAEDARGAIPQFRAPQGNQERFDPVAFAQAQARENLGTNILKAGLGSAASVIGVDGGGLLRVASPVEAEIVPNTAATNVGRGAPGRSGGPARPWNSAAYRAPGRGR